VLLTWHKNRKPDSKMSRFLSYGLIFAVLGILVTWMISALTTTNECASFTTVLACICFSTLAIVDGDRQVARRQATVAASLGLALFAATAILGIKFTQDLTNSFFDEPKYVALQAEKYRKVFPDDVANAVTPHDVKLKSK
jgi:hypothetical protein